MIPERIKQSYLSLLDPIVSLSIKLKVHPNTFTTLCLLAGIYSFFLFSVGSIRLGSLMIILSGIFDNIDGKLARKSGKVTKFGALYDSTMDRYSETFIFFGIAYFFIKNHLYLTSIAVAVSLGGSLMISYVRARAESLGFDCNIGLLQRAERIVLLGILGFIHLYGLIAAIWIIAVLSHITVIQRIIYVWKKDRKNQ